MLRIRAAHVSQRLPLAGDAARKPLGSLGLIAATAAKDIVPSMGTGLNAHSIGYRRAKGNAQLYVHGVRICMDASNLCMGCPSRGPRVRVTLTCDLEHASLWFQSAPTRRIRERRRRRGALAYQSSRGVPPEGGSPAPVGCKIGCRLPRLVAPKRFRHGTQLAISHTHCHRCAAPSHRVRVERPLLCGARSALSPQYLRS
jgi:hypothetical protein